jgi:hypothetical protein
MYSRSAKGGEKGDPNRNPWQAKMLYDTLIYAFYQVLDIYIRLTCIDYGSVPGVEILYQCVI